MSLELLIRGHQSATHSLVDSAFTKANYGVRTNATLNVMTPVGVLGGTVAAVDPSGDYLATAGNGANTVLGVFYHNAQGEAWENQPAIASGKVTIIKGQASVKVDVYETRNAADDADLTYAVGDYVYSSAQGFLTNQKPSDAGIANAQDTIIGVVTEAPATVGDALGLDLRV